MADPVTLCGIDDVKKWLNMGTDASPADDFITSLIEAKSSDFLNEIKRPDFYPATLYTEVREGDGGSAIVLRHWPINSIESLNLITDYGSPLGLQAIPEAELGVAGGYYIDSDIDPERRYELFMDGRVYTFVDGSEYLIAYNAGYESVPSDVADAVAYWAAAEYKSQQWIGQTSQHMAQGESVTAIDNEIPARVKRIIERYRRFDPLQTPPERVPLLDMSKRQGPKR